MAEGCRTGDGDARLGRVEGATRGRRSCDAARAKIMILAFRGGRGLPPSSGSVSRFFDRLSGVLVFSVPLFYNARLDTDNDYEVDAMPRVCHFTGKKTRFGHKVTHRGKAKYLGGVGTKITGISSRKFRPNIQKVRAIVNGRVVRIKVSAKAIRNGLVVKPVRRKYEKTAA